MHVAAQNCANRRRGGRAQGRHQTTPPVVVQPQATHETMSFPYDRPCYLVLHRLVSLGLIRSQCAQSNWSAHSQFHAGAIRNLIETRFSPTNPRVTRKCNAEIHSRPVTVARSSTMPTAAHTCLKNDNKSSLASLAIDKTLATVSSLRREFCLDNRRLCGEDRLSEVAPLTPSPA
jgi:hypothetical protein